MKITQEYLHSIFDYNKKTGEFIWKQKTSKFARIKIGQIAGTKDSKGRIQIAINKHLYFAHKLAFMYTYGYFPENEIDHKNRDKTDNSIDNLRETYRVCNCRNVGNTKRNTSGIKGVGWMKSSNKWRADICINKKLKYLGLYNDFDDAVCARLAAEQCLDWENCNSDSPAYLYVKENIL